MHTPCSLATCCNIMRICYNLLHSGHCSQWDLCKTPNWLYPLRPDIVLRRIWPLSLQGCQLSPRPPSCTLSGSLGSSFCVSHLGPFHFLDFSLQVLLPHPGCLPSVGSSFCHWLQCPALRAACPVPWTQSTLTFAVTAGSWWSLSAHFYGYCASQSFLKEACFREHELYLFLPLSCPHCLEYFFEWMNEWKKK